MTSFRDSGFVYAIRAEHCDYVKIGWSAEPIRRVLELQTGCPTPLRLVATASTPHRYEEALHRVLLNSPECRRVHGEWFDTPLDDEAISRLFYEMERFAAALTPADRRALLAELEEVA